MDAPPTPNRPEQSARPTAVGEASAAPDAVPFELEYITITRREYIELQSQAHQYRSLHARALKRMELMRAEQARTVADLRARQALLRTELEQTRAQLRGLRQQAFGTRSEKAASCTNLLQQASQRAHPRRARGQQPGRRGHGRTRETHLPERVQTLQLDGCVCPRCGKGVRGMHGTQDAEVLEIEVKAYRRLVRRHRYRPTCNCGVLPGIVTAPAPRQLTPRGKLGNSLLVEALLSKYRYGQPTHRLLDQWSDQGLFVAAGTLAARLQHLVPLFEPWRAASLARLRQARYWHADETRWEVFEPYEGKAGHRWYLWVFQTDELAHFVMNPTRAASVPAAALEGVEAGVLSVDRYAAYRKFAQSTAAVQLALCWAHQRRDFLALANQHPEHAHWALQWIYEIAELYKRHAARRYWCFERGSLEFMCADEALREHTRAMQARCEAELVLHAAQPAIVRLLRSLQRHWPGLITFLEHPHIDLDNNVAERAIRPAVIGRKNYYGSGCQRTGELAATMLSVFTTLDLWRINPRSWLTQYLQACTLAGGRAPPECSAFIPWQMRRERLTQLRQRVQEARM